MNSLVFPWLGRARVLALVLACGLGAGCVTWRPVQSSAGWTLYVKDGEEVDVARFRGALDPAFAAVEERMGPFEHSVRVHAWDGSVEMQGGNGGVLRDGESGEMQEVPGIGPARVRAFHVRAGARLFEASGVFLGTAEVGTAVHELVHARLAEGSSSIPLWFEEGLASFYGDGAFFGGRWVVDGLACWPLRELRVQEIEDEELARLLHLSARDTYDARENLLVHFVGWAIVFDLARERPDAGWRQWLADFESASARDGLLSAARQRIERTIERRTHQDWLERLKDADPGVRMAAAKGTWKLRSESAVDALLDALESEQDPDVRVALAVNALLSTGDLRMGRQRWRRLSALAFPALREPHIENEQESTAAQQLYEGMRWGSRKHVDTQEAIEELARFWEE